MHFEKGTNVSFMTIRIPVILQLIFVSEKTLKISGNYGDLQQIDIADRCRLREYIRSSCPR